MTEIFIDILEGSNNTITVTENDNLTETYKLILMKNRIRINLTDKKVKFVFVKSNSKNGDIFDEMNISNPAEGEVELPITNQISKENGMYSCGLAIYNNQGYLEHTGIFNLYVKENLFEKVSNELIEHDTYKKLTSLLDKASDMNSKLVTNTSEANKVNNTAINLRNALEGEVNRANQVNDTLTKTNSAAVDKNTTLNNSLEEAKKLLTAVDKYNLDNYMRKVDIPSDRDCNSFKEINVFCVFDTGAGDFKNTPEGTLDKGSARVFIIINRGFTTTRFQQEFINLYPQDRITRYIRNFNADGNGIWGNWYKVYDEANKPTPNDIGTYAKQEIDNNDTSTLNSAKSYADEKFKAKEPTTFSMQDLYVAVRTANRKTGQYYEFWDPNAQWADIKCGELYASQGRYKVYHAGNKPTPSDIGASPSDHNHDDRYFTRNAPRIKGVDINTYSTGGFYSVVYHDQPCTNLPVASDGYLIVIPWSSGEWCSQIFINDNEGDTYIRTKTGSEVNQWTSWGKIYDSNHKPTAQDIGASPSNHNHDNVYLGRKGEINSSTDFNTITEAGMYKVQNITASTPNSPIKAIPNLYAFGILLVFKSNVESEDRVLQIYYPHQAWQSTKIPISRMKNNNDWTPWERVTNGLTASDVGARPSDWNPTWNDVQDKPSSFQPSEHNHDDLYFRKGSWNTNGEQDLLVHGKRALVGTPEGNLYLGYGGDFTALYFGWNKIYHQGFKPTPADIGASPSDHNHDDRYLKKEVGATNESLRFRSKFLEFGVDDSRLGELGVGPTDTYIHNTKSNKYLALKDDGRLFYNNKEVCDRGHFTGDPGLNGYQMFPSGLLVQWGYVDMGKDTTKLVNFQKSFKDNNYNLQVSVYGGPGRVPAVKTYYAKNNNFYIQCEAGFCVYWEAKGSV
ncbi:BppU family phage baseplate upper protein [Clostridium baratii]|uniref:BppU family phage baseplate upper protein n=1 Tax=Clostridium baratii TaxID=1561 RepID=UPI0030D60335